MNSCGSLLSARCVVLSLMLGISSAAFAQDDIFITVSSPSGTTAPKAKDEGLLPTVSSPAAAQPAPKPASLPVVQPAKPVVQPSVAKKEAVEKDELELLRDPFWPVGYFPEGWNKKTSGQGEPSPGLSDWENAAAKIKINGTSSLGGRAAAFVNGELRSAGDQVEVVFEGKTFQWQVVGIGADGKVQLKKLGIR